MKTVSRDQVATSEVAGELALPSRVQEVLGELVNSAKEGLLALSVGVGLGVVAELMEEEVDEVVGPKGKHNLGRTAVRHGHESGEVTLGGRRVQVERPRVRSADAESEVPLRTYQHFADRDPFGCGAAQLGQSGRDGVSDQHHDRSTRGQQREPGLKPFPR